MQEKAGVVSQYTEVYCDCGVKARLDCIAIQCPAKPRYGHGGAWQQAQGTLGSQRQGRVGAGAGGNGAGARGTRRRARRRHGRDRSARGARYGHWAELRRAAGQRAMHLVQSICFWPGLTQYYSWVKFLDIVREPGS